MNTDSEVLLKSGRRCCLCYCLYMDFDVKRGQIAHIDHNSSNNEIDNLAFLCLEHHDLYDSRTSQSKGFSESELRQYRNMLYDYVKNRFSTHKTNANLKHGNDHTALEVNQVVTETKVIPLDENADTLAFGGKADAQPDAEAVDYITNSTEETRKELTFLSNRLKALQKEKESAELLGILGSAKAADAEIKKVRSRVEICRERNSIIEAGYELWDRIGFRLTCEGGGFLDIWETIGEMKDDVFHPNSESDIRIPMIVHKYFQEAIDSPFFKTFLVCSLYEDWYLEKLGDYCNYYLFATPYLDNNSIFLIAMWNTNDL